MTVRFSSKLPPLEGNGFAPLEEALAANPAERRIIIGVVNVGARFDPHATGELEPQVRFIQVEVMQGEDGEAARELLMGAYRDRTGATELFDPKDLYDSEDGAE